MKNHWTDIRAFNDFVKIVSEKVGAALNVDPDRVRLAMLEDIKDRPLDADEIKLLRETPITDEVIANMIEMMPDDIMKQLKGDSSCGLW